MKKHPSLLGLVVIKNKKRLYNFETKAKCYKTFYTCNLQMLVKS